MKLALLFLVLITMGLIAQSTAQTGVPGVKKGDYVIYDIYTNWESDDPFLSPPEMLLNINNTLWYRVDISEVKETNVTSVSRIKFKDETEDLNYFIQNIKTGEMYHTQEGFRGIFLANLEVNDYLWTMTDEWWVNKTITENYAGEKREINVVTATLEVEDDTETRIGTETLTLYIDKKTGMLVEREIYTVFPDQTGTQRWILKETNLWGERSSTSGLQLPLPLITAVIAAVVITAISVFIINKKRSNKRI